MLLYSLMNIADKNIVILYHGDCSDGFSGAWAAWKKFGDQAAYIGVQYKNPMPEGLINKEIYLIDFTYGLEQMEKLIAENKKVTCIDHHITAEPIIKLTQNYSFDNNHSGCVLAWKYFHPQKLVPKFLLFVEDNDIGKWSIKGTEEVLAYIRTEEQNFKNWSRLVKKIEKISSRKKILEIGAAIKKFEGRIVSGLIERKAELVEFEGIQTLCVNSPSFPTNIGRAIVKKMPPMAIIWNKEPGGIYVSLRSNGTTDVAKIAQKYGGGGHKAAAGFFIKNDEKIPWKNKTF